MQKSGSKIKAVAVFFIVLFIQRAGFSMWVNNYITSHIYKEQKCSQNSFKKVYGKVRNPTMIANNGKIVENNPTVFVATTNYNIAPTVYFFSNPIFSSFSKYYHDYSYVKKKKPRGPPTL